MLHQGKLVIAANEFTARYLLPVLHMFHRMHPMIRIQVMRTLAREVPAQVLNHDVEFGVVSFRTDDNELTSHMLYRDELALIVYPRHPLAKAKSVGIKDLGAESLHRSQRAESVPRKSHSGVQEAPHAAAHERRVADHRRHQAVRPHGKRRGAGAAHRRRT